MPYQVSGISFFGLFSGECHYFEIQRFSSIGAVRSAFLPEWGDLGTRVGVSFFDKKSSRFTISRWLHLFHLLRASLAESLPGSDPPGGAYLHCSQALGTGTWESHRSSLRLPKDA